MPQPVALSMCASPPIHCPESKATTQEENKRGFDNAMQALCLKGETRCYTDDPQSEISHGSTAQKRKVRQGSLLSAEKRPRGCLTLLHHHHSHPLHGLSSCSELFWQILLTYYLFRGNRVCRHVFAGLETCSEAQEGWTNVLEMKAASQAGPIVVRANGLDGLNVEDVTSRSEPWKH